MKENNTVIYIIETLCSGHSARTIMIYCSVIIYLYIFDAKYYNLQLEKGKALRGNPGIGDITKQYLYQLAYRKFIQAHNISVVKNCFLMPTERSEIIPVGTAKLPMLEALGLENIQVRKLPAKMMYDYYLSKKKIDISTLNL